MRNKEVLDMFDSNNDGIIDFAEAQAAVKAIKAETGVSLPAVTQIIQKTAINYDTWFEKVNRGIDLEAERQRIMNKPHVKAAISRGRKTANALEQDITDTDDAAVNAALKEMAVCMEGFESFEKEAALIYKNIYWGKADLIGEYEGELVIADNKVTNKAMPVGKDGNIRPSAYKNYGMQLCAYAKAYNHMFNTNIETGVLFVVSGKDELTHTKIIVDIDEYWEEFQYRVRDFYCREAYLRERQLNFFQNKFTF